jgi:hypothetical protein
MTNIAFYWRRDIQHNNTQDNDIQLYDTQHNDIQLNDAQHKGLIRTLSITKLFSYAGSHIAECHALFDVF